MKKIAFINIYDYLHYGDSELPLGLISLNEILIRQNIDSEVIDFQYLYNENKFEYKTDINQYISDISDYILKLNKDILSFYTMCSNLHIIINVAKKIKNKNPNILIGLGGPQASITSNYLMAKYQYIDFIGIGEGENSIINIYKKLIHIKDDKNIVNGLVYRIEDEIIDGGEPKLLQNLDDLPILEYEGFNISSNKCLSIDVGRGCPFSCSFCSTQKFWKRNYRLKSVDRIIYELKYYKKKYGIKYFSLQHDMFTADKNRIDKFCDKLLSENINISWMCSSRIDVLDEKIVKKMLSAGLVGMYIGIESGSQRIQYKINKNLNLEEAYEKIVKFSELGLNIMLSFMYGFPEENEGDIESTLQYIYKICKKVPKIVGHVQMHKLAFFAGTDITSKNLDKLFWDKNVENNTIFYLDRNFLNEKNYPREIFPHFYDMNTDVRKKYKEMDKFLVIFFLRTLKTYYASYAYLFENQKMHITDYYKKYIEYLKKSKLFENAKFFNVDNSDILSIINNVGLFLQEDIFPEMCRKLAKIEMDIAWYMYKGDDLDVHWNIDIDYIAARKNKYICNQNIILLSKNVNGLWNIAQINIDNIIKQFINIFINVIHIKSDQFILCKNGNMYKISYEDYKKLDLFINAADKKKIIMLDHTIALIIKKVIGYYEKNSDVKHIASCNYPGMISIQITNKCNLRCLHCYNSSGKTNNELDVKKIVKIIDWMELHDIFYLGLTGGEALLHSKIDEIIRYAKEKGRIIILNSNGKLLSEIKCKYLKKLGVDMVNLSLDGTNDIHNFIRNDETSFNKVIEALNNLKKIGINREIFFTCNNKNYMCLNDLISILRKNECKLNVLRFHKIGRGKNSGLETLSNTQLKYVFEICEKNNDVVELDKCYIHPRKVITCKQCHQNILTIRCQGDIVICPYILKKELILGNIYQDDLNTINEKRKEHCFYKMQKEDFNSICSKCKLFYRCYGGCRAEALCKENLLQMDPQCPLGYGEKIC